MNGLKKKLCCGCMTVSNSEKILSCWRILVFLDRKVLNQVLNSEGATKNYFLNDGSNTRVGWMTFYSVSQVVSFSELSDSGYRIWQIRAYKLCRARWQVQGNRSLHKLYHMFNENLRYISAQNKAIIRLHNINCFEKIKQNTIYNKMKYHSIGRK